MEHIKNFTDYLVRQSWQVAILFLLVAIGSFLLRNKSSHWRYLLWCVILAKCLLPPVMTFNAAVLPNDTVQEISIVDYPASDFRNQTSDVGLKFQEPKLDSRLRGNDTGVGRANQSGYAAMDYIKEHLRIFVFAIWGIGAVAFLLVAGVKAFLLNRWILRHRQLPGEDVLGEIEKLKSTVSSEFLGRIWVVEKITQPFVWGLWRGNAYLPAESKNSADVIMHELAHIIRLDAFVNLLQIFAQAIFWFHPLVWLANNKIRAEREKSCDEIAIARLKVSPRSYSSAVVDVLVREYQARRALPSLAVAGPVKNIEERIKTIMAQGKKFYSRPTAAAVITVLVLAAICVPTTVALTKAGEPDFVIKGKVVDSATGKPIAGAKVGDAERYNEGKFQTITDANGDYSYKTWYEEHNLKCQAAGYESKNESLFTKVLGSEKEKVINFELRPNVKATEGTEVNADLYIEDFSIRPYEAGGLYTVTVKIGNHGTVDAPQFRLNFYKGNPADNLNLHGKPQTGYHGAGPIKAGDFWNESSSSSPFALKEGKNLIFVVLDINNEVAEANENNNQAMLGIVVKDGKIVEKRFAQSVIITQSSDGQIGATMKGVRVETIGKSCGPDDISQFGAGQAEGTEGQKEKLQNLVEDFFKNNYRDITARKTIEWGEPIVDANGNMSIRYKYEATIWGKDKIITNQLFVFDKDGKVISFNKIEDDIKIKAAETNVSDKPEVYIVKFRPNNRFNPQTPKELLDVFNDTVKGRVKTHHFRTKIENDILAGYVLCDSKAEQKAIALMLADSSEIEFVGFQLATEDKLARHYASEQQSLNTVSKGTAFDNLLSKKVTVDIDKSPDGSGLTVQYAVMAVCEAAGVPYKWDKSAKLAEPQRLSFIKPLHIKDKTAHDAIADILKPFGLNYATDWDGLFIYKNQEIERNGKQEKSEILQKDYIPSTSTLAANGRIIDKIDYPFVDDPQVIGQWVSVDFVDDINDFQVGKQQWNGDLYLKELVILSRGKTSKPWWTWTNGLIFHSGDKTASKYIIKHMGNRNYMFFEWKSGDYTIRYMKPKYYVLKKTGND